MNASRVDFFTDRQCNLITKQYGVAPAGRRIFAPSGTHDLPIDWQKACGQDVRVVFIHLSSRPILTSLKSPLYFSSYLIFLSAFIPSPPATYNLPPSSPFPPSSFSSLSSSSPPRPALSPLHSSSFSSPSPAPPLSPPPRPPLFPGHHPYPRPRPPLYTSPAPPLSPLPPLHPSPARGQPLSPPLLSPPPLPLLYRSPVPCHPRSPPPSSSSSSSSSFVYHRIRSLTQSVGAMLWYDNIQF